MPCTKCGGTMIGDGFTTVSRCENLEEGDHEFAAPVEGPFYCDHEDLELVDAMKNTYSTILENQVKPDPEIDKIIYDNSWDLYEGL